MGPPIPERGITDRNQPAALTLHDLFSHAPQTRQEHPYCTLNSRNRRATITENSKSQK